MVPRQPPQNDPLEAARDAISELKDADDWDEPTGRTEVHVHVPQPSQPDTEDSLPEKAADATRTVLDGVNSWPKVAALGMLCAVLAFVAWLKWH